MNFPADLSTSVNGHPKGNLRCRGRLFYRSFLEPGFMKARRGFYFGLGLSESQYFGPKWPELLEMAVPMAEHLGRATSCVQNGRVSFACSLEEGTASSVCNNSQAPPCHPGALTLNSHLECTLKQVQLSVLGLWEGGGGGWKFL